MLRLFISNNPLVMALYVPVLAVVLLLYHLGGFVPPSGVLGIGNWAEHHSGLFLMLTGAVLLFLQAVIINRMVNDNKLCRKKNYAGGLLFILFNALFFETLLLQPPMLALTSCLLAFKRLFDAQGREKPYAMIFDFGSLLTVSLLCYAPALLFLPIAFVVISIIRPFSYREWGLLAAGLLMPVVAVSGYCYVFLDAVPLHHLVNWHLTRLHELNLQSGHFFSLAVVVFFMLFSALLLPRAVFATLIQVRKVVGCLLVFAFVAFVLLFVSGAFALHALVFVFFPLSVCVLLPLLEIRKAVLADSLLVILSLAIVFNAHSDYFLSLNFF